MSNYKKIQEFNFSDLKFSRTKKNEGLRFISVYYEKKPVEIKLPTLRIPFNSSVDKYGKLAFNISLGKDEELINKVEELDEAMCKFACSNGWFDSEFDYVHTLKRSKNNQYPPTLNIKVPVRDNLVKTSFYNNKKEIIEGVNTLNEAAEYLKKGTRVQTAIECVGAWFNGNRYGLSWKAVQVKILSTEVEGEDEQGDYLFESSDEEDKSDVELLIEEE